MRPELAVPGTTSHANSDERKLFALLEHAAAQWPEDTALVRGAQTFTFQQLKRAVNQLAAELLNSGIKPGTKLASCVLMGRNT
jgi:acyl-CoA synthetase (AMP-forming)/AMP-acid ligase II